MAKLTQEEVQSRIDNYFKEKITILEPYINRRTCLTLKCNECGYTWKGNPVTLLYKNKTGQHRCPQCLQQEKDQNKLYTKCAYCGKDIVKYKSQVDKNISGYFYCSHQCGNLHKNQLRKQSGEWDDSLNYRDRAFGKYEHKCLICGWNEDERILEVHHINENHNDNSIDNLCILCPTCHRKITLKYYRLDTNIQKLIKIK